MGRHLKAHDFFHLQFDIGIDLVVIEHAACSQELAILVEVFQRFAQRAVLTVGMSFNSSGGRS